MMRALRSVSTEKGRDPSEFALVAYGGSGPVHAAALAAELGARTVVVPPLAGVFSAVGLLSARAERHDVRFCRIDARAPDLALLRQLDAEMRADGDAWQRSADVRYRGQSWSVRVDLPGEIDAAVARRPRRAASSSSTSGSTARGSSPARRSTSARSGASRSVPSDPRPRSAQTARPETGRGSRTSATALSRHGCAPGTTCTSPPRDRFWSTSSTRRSSCRRVGSSASTAARARSSSTMSRVTAGARRHDSDIAVRLVGNALATLADEMATAVFRTAHSAVVRDAMDFSAALCGPSGETVAQAVTIPLQLGSVPNAMRTLLARHGDRLRAGRRLPRQRPVRRREPHARLLRRQAVLRRRPTPGLRRHRRAPRGRRRPRARHHRVRLDRGLPGGPPPPVAQARRPRRAGGGAVRDPPRERPHPARAARRPRRAGRGLHDRRPRAAGARRAASRSPRAVRRPPRPHGGAAPRRDRPLARRGRGVRRLHRLGRDRRLRRQDRRPAHRQGRRAGRRLLRVGADGARLAQLHALLRRGRGLPLRDDRLVGRHPAHGRGAAPDHRRDAARHRAPRRHAERVVDAGRGRVPRLGRRQRRARAAGPGADRRGRRRRLDARLVHRPGRRRAVRLQRARGRHVGRAAGPRRQRRAREPVRVDRERARRGGGGRVADRRRAVRPRRRTRAAPAASAAGSRSSAPGAASPPTPSSTCAPTGSGTVRTASPAAGRARPRRT